jgi:hypothetical protein
LLFLGMDFENDREHLQHPNLSKIARGKGDASCRNLRAGPGLRPDRHTLRRLA